MSTKVRDSQRSKVYGWENDLFKLREALEDQNWELSRCEELIIEVSHAYGIVPPTVSDGRGKRRATYQYAHRIDLPRWARRRYIVLHELAHALCHKWGPAETKARNDAAHGPTFVRVYLDLLLRFGNYGMTATELSRSARAAKVKIGEGKGLRAPSIRSINKIAELDAKRKALTIAKRQAVECFDKQIAAINQEIAQLRAPRAENN